MAQLRTLERPYPETSRDRPKLLIPAPFWDAACRLPLSYTRPAQAPRMNERPATSGGCVVLASQNPPQTVSRSQTAVSVAAAAAGQIVRLRPSKLRAKPAGVLSYEQHGLSTPGVQTGFVYY